MSITETLTATDATHPSPIMWQYRVRKGQRLDQLGLAPSDSTKQTSAAASKSASSSSRPSPKSTTSPAPSPSALSAIDSPFQLQEYLAMLVRQNPHDVERIVALPPESELDPRAAEDATDDDPSLQPVDTDIWVYEQLRRLVLDLSTPWMIALQNECDKHARPQTCAAMNAGDWMFLCASHGEEKQCCAIDYMIHTLDGATSLLNSARHFPSRTYVPSTSLRHFGAIARRLSRIFVHAWCYHRETFEACEAETSLYSRFYALVETYDLTATDNLPPRDRNVTRISADVFDRKTTTSPLKAAPIKETSLLSSSLQDKNGDDLGLIPPPAPSPRPAAILQRPDHEQVDPAWGSLDRSDSCASNRTAILIGDSAQNGDVAEPHESHSEPEPEAEAEAEAETKAQDPVKTQDTAADEQPQQQQPQQQQSEPDPDQTV